MDDRFKYRDNLRAGAYNPLVEGVKFILEVDKDKFTEEQQDNLANWITKAIVAKQGHDKHEQEIINFVNSVVFRVHKDGPHGLGRPVKLTDEQVYKVQEIFHWACAWVLGFDKAKPEVDESTVYGGTVHFH